MISQLMQLEAQPQTSLKNKVTTAQTAVASYLSVNSAISGFQSAGKALSQLDTWRAIKATSSSPTLSVSTSASINATTGSLTFNVTSLASKQYTTMAVDTTPIDRNNDGKMDSTTQLAVPDKITITTGSGATAKAVDVDVSADKSAAGIVNAINKANVGVTAYVLKTGDNQGVLQMTSTKTGAANGFQITGLDGAGLNGNSPATTAANDAQLQVNGGGGSTYTVSSSTNTFANLMPGVTLTATKLENNVTVDVSSDSGSIADKFQAMVDAANAALQEISKQTAYDPSTKKGSPLTGDFSVREMQQKILSSISTGLSYPDPNWTPPVPDTVPPSTAPKINFGSLSKLGIQLDSTGQLTFNRDTFNNAYANDPASIQTAGMAFGDQVNTMTTSMSTSLKSIMTSRNNAISDLNDQISNWDVRLAAKQEALQKQYADLEVALGKLKDQSSWLSGQLASLG
jgi:flagellar hook-associated protein 2